MNTLYEYGVLSVIAVVINVLLVLAGSALGLLFRNKISNRFSGAISAALGLCVIGIGVSSMIQTANTLCVIVCMVVGTLLGEWIDIEKRMDSMGELLRKKVGKGGENGRFVEGFVTATVLFCVGAMAINGSMEAGMLGKYDILISKSVMDGLTSITFAAAMGVGVAFCAIPILLYEGGMVLLFGLVGQVIPDPVILEMSAVGGTIIVGIAFNMLGFPREKLRVGNMLPAIFLPIVYIPLVQFLTGLIK